jgi:hypothetical protein
MKRCRARIPVFLLVLVILVPASVWASTGPQEQGGRREPPQEALDACTGKSEGTAVEMTTPRGDTIKATCREIDGRLVAVPAGGAPAPENGAPPPGEGRAQ